MFDKTDRIIRLKTMLDRTSLSRSTIYRKISEGTFPSQIPISIPIMQWDKAQSKHPTRSISNSFGQFLPVTVRRQIIRDIVTAIMPSQVRNVSSLCTKQCNRGTSNVPFPPLRKSRGTSFNNRFKLSAFRYNCASLELSNPASFAASVDAN